WRPVVINNIMINSGCIPDAPRYIDHVQWARGGIGAGGRGRQRRRHRGGRCDRGQRATGGHSMTAIA
ncbi:hypothetical protein, partial [Mycobacterium alsense]|uniref:hypothetical protein n=1 Tax=Mycobacterium alsense TaxID=324058 RepID=UPI0013F4D95F